MTRKKVHAKRVKKYGSQTVQENVSNKRPMGHIAHLKNQFKSMKTFKQSYDYIIRLIRRRKKPLSLI